MPESSPSLKHTSGRGKSHAATALPMAVKQLYKKYNLLGVEINDNKLIALRYFLRRPANSPLSGKRLNTMKLGSFTDTADGHIFDAC